MGNNINIYHYGNEEKMQETKKKFLNYRLNKKSDIINVGKFAIVKVNEDGSYGGYKTITDENNEKKKQLYASTHGWHQFLDKKAIYYENNQFNKNFIIKVENKKQINFDEVYYLPVWQDDFCKEEKNYYNENKKNVTRQIAEAITEKIFNNSGKDIKIINYVNILLEQNGGFRKRRSSLRKSKKNKRKSIKRRKNKKSKRKNKKSRKN